MKLHREGFGILSKLFVALIAINGALFFLQSPFWITLVVGCFSIILLLMAVNFFRLPHRHYDGSMDKKVIAPADGTIVAIEEVFEPEYFKEKRLQISVFMTVLNVHANWYPVKGVVALSKYHKGNFMAAYLPKSSTENERSTIVITLPDGTEVLTRQIAGALARRIVTYAKEGVQVDVNDQMGFIKFGSRVDVFLPLGSRVQVSLGQKVVATQTILAHLL